MTSVESQYEHAPSFPRSVFRQYVQDAYRPLTVASAATASASATTISTAALRKKQLLQNFMHTETGQPASTLSMT